MQFTQQDPIGIAGRLNLYGYANGDPINHWDPFGLDCKKRADAGTPCNLNTGNSHLDNPAIRDRLEDAWDVGVATPDPSYGNLPSEVAIACDARARCESGTAGNAVTTGAQAQRIFGWAWQNKGVLYMHTHQNAGVDIPGFGVGAPGPSNADRGNAAIATKAGIAYFIFEPNRILEIKSDGSQVAYDRWRKP